MLCWQSIEQNHDDVFVFQRYFQMSELIHERIDLVDVVQQIYDLLYLICEELVENEKKCWTNSSSCECYKGSSMPPHVLRNS